MQGEPAPKGRGTQHPKRMFFPRKWIKLTSLSGPHFHRLAMSTVVLNYSNYPTKMADVTSNNLKIKFEFFLNKNCLLDQIYLLISHNIVAINWSVMNSFRFEQTNRPESWTLRHRPTPFFLVTVFVDETMRARIRPSTSGYQTWSPSTLNYLSIFFFNHFPTRNRR